MSKQTQQRSRTLWLVLGLYVVCFIIFAGFDLYAEHTTQGLFTTHRTPFMHHWGNVVDPKPNQTINQELAARLRVPISNLPSNWFDDRQPTLRYVSEQSIRMPSAQEILVGHLRDGRVLLVLGQYRGEWVTFRPLLGVLLEPDDPLLSLQSGLVLEVPVP